MAYFFNPGNPPSDGAIRTARRIDSATASAAATPSESKRGLRRSERHRDHQIAVRHGVHRIDGPRHTQRCQLCELGGFHFGERGVGRDHHQRRVLRARPAARSSSGVRRRQIPWSPAILRAPAIILPVAGSRTSPSALTTARAETITPPGEGLPSMIRRRISSPSSCPEFCRRWRRFPRPPRLLRPLHRRRGRRRFPHLARGPHAFLCRCRDRRESRTGTIGTCAPPGLETHAFVLQKTAHAAGRFQAERAASGEHQARESIGNMQRAQHVPFVGPGGRSANVAARPPRPRSHSTTVQPVNPS